MMSYLQRLAKNQAEGFGFVALDRRLEAGKTSPRSQAPNHWHFWFRLVRVSRIITCIFALAILSGCGGAVKHKLAPGYIGNAPLSVAVMPVGGEVKDSDVKYLFRTMIYDRLLLMKYQPVALVAVDDKLLRMGLNRDEFSSKPPKEIASALGVDAVLYPVLINWSPSTFLTYASLTVEAKVELFEGSSGRLLWIAEYNTKQSDARLEKDVVEFAVVKTYEPVIHRAVDGMFSTIPSSQATAGGRGKAYYDWLP